MWLSVLCFIKVHRIEKFVNVLTLPLSDNIFAPVFSIENNSEDAEVRARIFDSRIMHDMHLEIELLPIDGVLRVHMEVELVGAVGGWHVPSKFPDVRGEELVRLVRQVVG